MGKGAEGCAVSFVVYAEMVGGLGDKSCLLSEVSPLAEVGELCVCLLWSGVLFCLLFDFAQLFCAVFILCPFTLILHRV